MQSFFLYVAPATIWNFGGELKKVLKNFLNTLLELLLGCKHMLITFVEVKIKTFLGSRS